jgi:cysteine synthase A
LHFISAKYSVAKKENEDMLTDNILDLIGKITLIRLKEENIFAKAEFLNPGGSLKDRVVLAML